MGADRVTLSRLAPSYWTSQLADIVDGDTQLRAIQRAELDRSVTTGVTRSELRDTFRLLTWTYVALSIPAALAMAAVWALTSAPVLTVVAALTPTFLMAEAVYSAIRWILMPSTDTEVVWRPLAVDCLLALGSLGFVLIAVA